MTVPTTIPMVLLMGGIELAVGADVALVGRHRHLLVARVLSRCFPTVYQMILVDGFLLC